MNDFTIKKALKGIFYGVIFSTLFFLTMASIIVSGWVPVNKVLEIFVLGSIVGSIIGLFISWIISLPPPKTTAERMYDYGLLISRAWYQAIGDVCEKEMVEEIADRFSVNYTKMMGK